MKKIIGLGMTLGLALALQSGTATAAKYGMAGCGLGTYVFENDNSKMQILAATTNGTFGSQTFGITTGTSNCTTGGTALDDKEQQLFVEANQKQLARDMAQGSGEYVTALGSLMGCSDTNQFASFAQKNYETIFPNSQTTGLQVLQAVKAEGAKDASLAAACTGI